MSETIGRRLSGDNIFEKRKDNRCAVDIRQFLDTNANSGVSVDRLGQGQPNKKRTEFLTPLCVKHEESRQPSREFKGWAWCQVRHISEEAPQHPVVEDSIPENPHHAMIGKLDMCDPENKEQNKRLSVSFAIVLREKFEKNGGVIQPEKV